MRIAEHKSGNGTVVMKEGDRGYIVTVNREQMPPHYSKPHDSFQEAAADFERLAKEREPVTIYIAKDADYWGAEPTDEEIATLVEHVKAVAQEWTQRPVEIEMVTEAFTHEPRNEALASVIVGAAWNRMFS